MLHLHSVYIDDIEDPMWEKESSRTSHDILLFVTQGQVRYNLNGEDIIIKKGELFYIRAGALRYATGVNGQPHQKYSAHFTLEKTGETTLRALAGPEGHKKAAASQFDYIKQRFVLLMQHWIGKLPYYVPLAESMTQELLAIACREFEDLNFPGAKMAHVKQLRQYILEHYTEQIRIEELAQLIERTPNYVTQMFREVSGITPIDYLHQVRVNAAKDLLLHTNFTIGHIADLLGYCDQSYFNRMFRRWTGSPPSSFFKENPNEPPTKV
ncbi:AraC family transcriptional regulator [Paenibacillus sp. HB172176]|uniref:helix-turn-helix transcriptional regulator n=1 Tax=Paenibacillus sp. HB172176 TaxID=2493690 RepID=UPI00143A4F78|nr:AraC family transcriptional regulator [Paenibacillus sp. HB172176]